VRRAMAVVGVTGLLGAAVVVTVSEEPRSTPAARGGKAAPAQATGGTVRSRGVSAGVTRSAATPAPDRMTAAGMVSLRALQHVVRGQAGRLRSEVAHCAHRPRSASSAVRPGRSRRQCLFMALVHAGAGARLNVVILAALARDVAAGACQRRLGRYASLIGALHLIARDAAQRSFEAPEGLPSAARSSVRLAADGAAAGTGPQWHADCAPLPPAKVMLGASSPIA
jgi:hypothetical protein